MGLIGPNGSGKSHLIRLFAGDFEEYFGEFTLGSRVVPGYFSQTNTGEEFSGRTVAEIISEYTGHEQATMSRLARYGLQGNARQQFATLSGGQKARLEVLALELNGANLLLLDEPTDNLDIDSSTALEKALLGFDGTVITVSHDRTFLQSLDHFLLLTTAGKLFDITDFETAMRVLSEEPRPEAAILPLSCES